MAVEKLKKGFVYKNDCHYCLYFKQTRKRPHDYCERFCTNWPCQYKKEEK